MLCERARGGDRAALGQLLRRHGPHLYRAVLLPRLGSRSLAEEALSTTYAKVVERFDQFEWREVGLYPWLRVIALRVAIDVLRAEKRERLFEPEELERHVNQAALEMADDPKELEQRDLAMGRARVAELLERINPRYALAIRLRILEGQSREQVATTLGVSLPTFDVVLHRAVASIRKLVEEGRKAGSDD